METGDLISFYRKQAGMTIDELVEKSGVPKGTLNKIIGGVTKAPTLDNMKVIARALGKTLADFDDTIDSREFFTSAEQDMIKKYRALDAYGQDTVSAVLDCEYKRCDEQRPIIQAAARGGDRMEAVSPSAEEEEDVLPAPPDRSDI